MGISNWLGEKMMKMKKVHLLYGHKDGLHFCQQPAAERFTTNVFKVTCEKCKTMRTRKLERVPEKEWLEECPFCGADCEYDCTGDEFESWVCESCCAEIQVPFRIVRTAGVFARKS